MYSFSCKVWLSFVLSSCNSFSRFSICSFLIFNVSFVVFKSSCNFKRSESLMFGSSSLFSFLAVSTWCLSLSISWFAITKSDSKWESFSIWLTKSWLRSGTSGLYFDSSMTSFIWFLKFCISLICCTFWIFKFLMVWSKWSM